MLVIVTYDVSTETPGGRRRLRRVAKACEKIGQRVQQSVFECRVSQMQYEQLERQLLEIIDLKEDNLIEVRGREIHLRNVKGLERLAND